MKASFPLPPSKLPETGTTIFTVISKLAEQYNAVNLGQGFPDFSPSDELISLVHDKMREGCNQYAPMAGTIMLRERITEKISMIYKTAVNAGSEITVTAGATQAIYTAITAFVQAGDEVLIIEPAYDCYEPAVRLCGAVPVFIPTGYPDYSVHWDGVREKINRHTRMIIINTPHNPTGNVLSSNDMQQLTAITAGTDIIVLSDEVYEHIVFDGKRHESVLHYPDLFTRSIAVFSFGKTYHATGWKTGYAVAPAALTAEFRKVHQFNVFCTNHPVQLAIASFMARSEEYLNLGSFYEKKRNYFAQLLSSSRFRLIPSAGTYFQVADYGAVSDEPDTAFANRLIREHGVAAIPVSVFQHHKTNHRLLRFCFAKSEATLEKAAEKLCAI